MVFLGFSSKLYSQAQVMFKCFAGFYVIVGLIG